MKMITYVKIGCSWSWHYPEEMWREGTWLRTSCQVENSVPTRPSAPGEAENNACHDWHEPHHLLNWRCWQHWWLNDEYITQVDETNSGVACGCHLEGWDVGQDAFGDLLHHLRLSLGAVLKVCELLGDGHLRIVVVQGLKHHLRPFLLPKGTLSVFFFFFFFSSIRGRLS